MTGRLEAAIAAALVAAVCGAPALRADRHETAGDAPRRMLVHTDHVDPGMVEAYEEKAKAWVAAFKEAGLEGPEWSWYTSSSPEFAYVTVFPFGAMADLDRRAERQAAIREALGEDRFAALNEPNGAVRRHVNEIARLRPELSYQPAAPAAGEGVGFMRVGFHHVKPGMEPRFEELMKRLAAAFAKAGHGLGFETFEVEIGEGGYVVTVVADDAAQFHGMPGAGEVLAGAVGPEAAREMYAEWRACVTAYEVSDWKIRADRSYDGVASSPAGGGE